ncbi:hypothetical protein [Balneola vulgaris]|jgi:hypothetical protein|uniref:hypothetical protein n=1 Tax=Balneola vulgaris TaxID=287535 RepID=UPI00036D8155|nr:hypothetical protein [Balneola vulgaris]
MFAKKNYKHKLVVVGDSLSQGFKNGGIYRTDINFPSFLHRCFDPLPPFHQPRFTAQAGIPINLEVILRGLADEFGSDINWMEYPAAATHTFKTLKRIKKYWEGGLKDLSINQPTPYHNQSIWGFAINDSWIVNHKNSQEYINENKESYSVFGVLPEHAKYVTSQLVLNPTLGETHYTNTQLDNIELLQEQGGIENLIVCLGHNNALGAVVNLELKWSTEEDLVAFTPHRQHSIYRPEHFEKEYRQLAERIHKLGVKRVFVPTIPYPTIPPVCRGVNSNLSSERLGYFDYYTRFWIWDEDFDPDRHPHLTKDEAIHIDLTVDEFNMIIRKVAKEYGWHVVPIAKNVAHMAKRRLGGETLRSYPDAFIQALLRNENTRHLVNDKGEAILTTDFLRLNDEGKIYKGGIFSLDGLHPTTIGYGLMANVYYNVMKQAGVDFTHALDWDHIIAEDTLITNPPTLLSELRSVLGFLALGNQERFFKLGKNIMAQALELLSTGTQD